MQVSSTNRCDALTQPQIDRVGECLMMWKDAQDRGGMMLGFPKQSAVFSSGGVNCWDDIEDGAWHYIVTLMDTIIRDLPNVQRLSVLMVTGQMAKVFSFGRITIEEAFDLAVDNIWRKLHVWGVA